MAGTNRTKQKMADPSPIIILVEPQLSENIGMAARAMANFGLNSLRLVRPREDFPNERAIATASKANHIIENTIIFDSLEEAVADLQYVLATTARQRDGFKPVLSAVEAATILRKNDIDHRIPVKQTAILFGRERFGLSNEELSLADQLVTFPVDPAFASLNIAQAVLLMSYEWMKSGLSEASQTVFRGPNFEPAPKKVLHSFFHRLENALECRGYFRPKERKPIMIDNLRAVLTRADFSEDELHLLSGVLSSLDKFSPRQGEGQKNTQPDITSIKEKANKEDNQDDNQQ